MFGRSQVYITTLITQSSQPVAELISPLCRILLKLKSEILSELQKYKPKSFENSLAFDRGRGSPADARGDKVKMGGLCLRFTVEQLNKLLEDLEKYRPDRLDAYRARISARVA